MANGLMVNWMDKVFSSEQMAITMKVNGRMIKLKDMGLAILQMEIIIKVIGKMIKEMEKEIIYGMIKMSIKEHG